MIQRSEDLTSVVRAGPFLAVFRAARLVPNTGGASSLPSSIGTIQFRRIDEQEAKELRIPRSKLLNLYPELQVLHYALIVDDRPQSEGGYMVERNGQTGIAIYIDFNGSGLCTSTHSANGLNPVCPLEMDGPVGSVYSPRADFAMGWRLVDGHWLQNHLIHGWSGFDGRDYGLDWLDGRVSVRLANLEDMHDRTKGQVAQYIFVPRTAQGLGMAEQVLPEDYTTQTYSMIVTEPGPELPGLIARLNIDDGSGRLESMAALSYSYALESAKSLSRSMTKDDEQVTMEPDLKMAAGGLINQHIIQNPFAPSLWKPQPSYQIVLWPVTTSTAMRIFAPRTQSGKTIKTF